MSEEKLSPKPDESSKVEEAGSDADVAAAASGSAVPAQVSTEGPTLDAPGQSAAGAAPDPVSQALEEDANLARSEAHQAAVAKIEGDISMRRSPWKSSLAAIRYVQEAAKTDHVQIRTSDRLTIIALLFFCIAEVLSLVYSPLHGFRFAFMCCCDFVLGTCIVLFLIYRIGILSALNRRQALICWQMMMGCILLGIFLCLNSIFAIACLVEALFPHPML